MVERKSVQGHIRFSNVQFRWAFPSGLLAFPRSPPLTPSLFSHPGTPRGLQLPFYVALTSMSPLELTSRSVGRTGRGRRRVEK